MALKPPPPPAWRLPNRSRFAPTGEPETVTADRLRPDDWLVTGDEGPLRLRAVEVDAGRVRLLTHGAWWSVRSSTRFVRLRQSRRIEMRPDLRRGDQ
jgi:hypothetical protein